eukprot:2167275-Rhodomonas_salina.1
MPKYTAHINIRKSKRAGQQSTGITTLILEQLAKGVKQVWHRTSWRLTTVKYMNPLSGKLVQLNNAYFPAGSTAKETRMRKRLMEQVFRTKLPT